LIDSIDEDMKPWYWIVLMILGLFAVSCSRSPEKNTQDNYELPSFRSYRNQISAFKQATGPRDWVFPDDFGAHPNYETEWWYYTGNLESQSGKRFGYQLTFFRRALSPAPTLPERTSSWATDQIYMAHFAVSDINDEKHYDFERYSRGAVGLAGTKASPFEVWLDDWQVSQISNDQFRLSAKQDQIKLELILQDVKGLVFHGDQGYSQKGPDPGDASYYFSQTRLETNGEVKTTNGSYAVSGLSWMDHEFSTSALSEGQIGWDWFSIQLGNNQEIMLFQIRRNDGSVDPRSSGTIIDTDGQPLSLQKKDFEIKILKTWQSPDSEVEYPSKWRIEIPDHNLILELDPSLENQEMNLSITYWEGAVDVSGTKSGIPIEGRGYVELTGYGDSLEGGF
jgi:predicted secreted hydrolase